MTRQKRKPWKRPGGTTFYFTDENILEVLEKAKQSAGKKEVRISGGANVIQQYINAGLVDELYLHIAPIILGKGVRLFENLEKSKFFFKINNVINSPEVTHIIYQVYNKK